MLVHWMAIWFAEATAEFPKMIGTSPSSFQTTSGFRLQLDRFEQSKFMIWFLLHWWRMCQPNKLNLLGAFVRVEFWKKSSLLFFLYWISRKMIPLLNTSEIELLQCEFILLLAISCFLVNKSYCNNYDISSSISCIRQSIRICNVLLYFD